MDPRPPINDRESAIDTDHGAHQPIRGVKRQIAVVQGTVADVQQESVRILLAVAKLVKSICGWLTRASVQLSVPADRPREALCSIGTVTLARAEDRQQISD